MRKTRLWVWIIVAIAMIALATPVHATVTNFSVNTTNTNVGIWYFVYCLGSLPSPAPVPSGLFPVAVLPQNCYNAAVSGLATAPYTAGAGVNVYVIAPSSTSGAALTYFQGWAAQMGTLCTAPTCNLLASSPIVTTNSTLYLTSQTGSWNLLAVYGTSPPPSGCIDPLNIGWTGRTVGCFFGVSNIYFVLIVGVPLVVATPFLVTLRPKRTK